MAVDGQEVLSFQKHGDEGVDFKHEPLMDASAQIRLVKIEAGNIEDLQLNLSTWDIGTTPPYHTISYTWGEHVECAICINHGRFIVRKASRYALWQAWLYDPEQYVWIDSICIDQQNDEEKSRRVHMMFGIYRQSDRVLACIGPQENDSDKLARATKAMLAQNITATPKRSWKEDPGQGQIPFLLDDHWKSFFDEQTEDELSEIRNALSCFTQRPYWSRRWVYQEIVAANESVDILCGEEIFSRAEVRLILQLIGEGIPLPPPPHIWNGVQRPNAENLRTMTYSAEPQSQRLGFSLSNARNLKCSEVRDSIFALWSLVKWKDGAMPIVPDYGMSISDLLLKSARHIECLERVQYLLDALQVDRTHPALIDIFRKRGPDSQKSEAGAQDPKDDLVQIRAGFTCHAVFCAFIHASADGGLAVSIDGFKERSSIHDSSVIKLSTLVEGSSGDRKTRLYHRSQTLWLAQSDEIAGYTCEGTKKGDIAVFWDQAIFLVIRSNAYGSFDVVGQGFLLVDPLKERFDSAFVEEQYDANLLHSLQEASKLKSFRAVVELNLTAEDMILISGQDFESTFAWSPEGRFERLFTNPATYPRGAATIVQEI